MAEAKLVREVEEIAARAWPAAVVRVVDGWRLRATPGVEVRRSNSVLPNGGDGTNLEAKLAAVDEFSREHGIPVRYQMSAAAVPPELDDVLAARGLDVEMLVDVQVADLTVLVEHARERAPDVQIAVDPLPTDDWLDAMLGVTARAEREVFRPAILDRIDRPARYASAVDPEGVMAVGMCVVVGEWLGIFSMATLPQARRRGYATAVLRALAEAGTELGASRSFLQTERSNAASHALYEGLGFATAYGYHYRIRR